MIQEYRNLQDKNSVSLVRKKQLGYIQNQYEHMMPVLSQPKIAQKKQAAQKTALQKSFKSFIKQKIFGNLVLQYGDKQCLKPSHHHCNSLERIHQKSFKRADLIRHKKVSSFLTSKDNIIFNMKDKFKTKIIDQIKNKSSLKRYEDPQYITPNRKAKLHSISLNISQMAKKQLSQSIKLREEIITAPNKNLFTKQQKVDSKNISLFNTGQNTQVVSQAQQYFAENKRKKSILESGRHQDLSFISSIDISDNSQIFQSRKKMALPLIKKMQKSQKNDKIKKSLFIQQFIQVQVWSNITVQETKLKQPPKNLPSGSKMILVILAYANLLLDSKVLSRSLYLNHMKSSFQKLSNKFLNYFDPKLVDGLSRKQYANQINESLIRPSKRVWAFMCFQFFDSDKNGIIDSSDLFTLYKQLENQIQQTQINLQNNKGFETTESRKQKCRKMLIEQINILNQQIIQNKKNSDELNLRNQVGNYSSLNSFLAQNQDLNNLQFLEEGFIKNHQIVSKDIEQIVKEDESIKNSTQKKFALNITQGLQLKFSSIYRQSFLATQHNQDTRLHRQKIQRLKQQLKEERQKRVIKNGGITYQVFLQKHYEKNIKKYLIQFHGWKAGFQ